MQAYRVFVTVLSFVSKVATGYNLCDSTWSSATSAFFSHELCKKKKRNVAENAGLHMGSQLKCKGGPRAPSFEKSSSKRTRKTTKFKKINQQQSTNPKDQSNHCV